MKKKNEKYILYAIGIIPLAFVVISLIPIRMAISDEKKFLAGIKLQPGERWYVVENCQYSNSSWESFQNDKDTRNVSFSELSGNNPWDSFSNSFGQGHLPGGIKNRYVLIGKAVPENDESSEIVFNVRKWYIIAPVNRDFMIGPPWYLTIFDVKLFHNRQ